MSILVTGATGQLGSAVYRELKRRGVEYRGVSSRDFDLTDKTAVTTYLRMYRPEAVIHCAAYTAVDQAESEPDRAFAVNRDGTRYLAEICRELDARLLYISTDYVFDGQGTMPWKPEDSCHPLNVYGQSKLEGERAIQQTLEQYFIVRISWLFGDNGKHFVRTMLNLSRTHSSVRVVDDQFGTPTYAADLARLLADMINSEQYGVYHAANSGSAISWYDFAREIYRQSGLSTEVVPITTEEYVAAANRPRNSRLDTGKLSANGFASLPDWRDALRRYLEKRDTNI